MKVAISLPDELFTQADRFAARVGLNRSQLYARAIEAYLANQDRDPVTQALDDLADELGPAPDAAAGRALIDGGHWELSLIHI